MLCVPQDIAVLPNHSFALLWPKHLSLFGDLQSSSWETDKGAVVPPSRDGEWERAEKGKAKSVF